MITYVGNEGNDYQNVLNFSQDHPVGSGTKTSIHGNVNMIIKASTYEQLKDSP